MRVNRTISSLIYKKRENGGKFELKNAKQTQFSKGQSELKYLYEREL
jgi:hypothetical protein